jgi:hypothetical protein
MNKNQSCGFGAPIDSFYKGVNNVLLTPDIKKCLNIVYGPGDASYNRPQSYPPDIQKSMGFGVLKSEIKYLKRK